MSLLTLLSGPVLPEKKTPTASAVASPQYGVLGSVVKLDGRSSSDPDGLPLVFTWTFASVPIGSQVSQEGFRSLEQDLSLVSFSPDIVGEYVVNLVVSNGMFSSEAVLVPVSIRALLVPHGRGIVPDGKFIWSYIRDIWTQVDGKAWFETLWSALIQIIGNDFLSLYQNDFNKSIRDIQDLYQRRWLSYEPKLLLNETDLSFYLGTHSAGSDANTGSIGVSGLAIIFAANELIVYSGNISPNVSGDFITIQTSLGSGNIGSFEIERLNSSRTGYTLKATLDPAPDTIAIDVPFLFAFQSQNWNLVGGGVGGFAEAFSIWGPPLDSLLPIFSNISPGTVASIHVGDVIHFPTGPNAGFYKIIEKSGTFIKVDKKPPSFSGTVEATTYKTTVYRPVPVIIPQPEEALTDTIAIEYSSSRKDLPALASGRVVDIGGQTFTTLRTGYDENQRIPLIVFTTTEKTVTSGLKSQFWRVPHTLVSKSQNFEELGVSGGDLFLFDVVLEESQTTVQVVGQVVGVDQYRLGFVLTDEPIPDGSIPDIPNKTFQELASGFGFSSSDVIESQDGSLLFSGLAGEMLTYLSSSKFQKDYGNVELTTDSIFNVVGTKFTLHPRSLFRNRLLPVDSTLRSIPVLQDWIVQPTYVEREGKFFQVYNNQEFELKNKPSILTENFDFIIDADYALDEELTFKSGIDTVETDYGDFVDRGISTGDEFIILQPLTLSGTYLIESVDSKDRLTLTRPVPLYALGEIVTCRVRIKRRRSGHFLRFVPSRFTAKQPAPERLWGEASFFDNSGTVEDNFGILVALKKSDLDNISSSVNYRQAVAGLMFAFTKGSSIDRVRLGAQILLGLPFTEHRGIIRSIEDNYRLNINGVPVLGRLLIEDVDSTNEPLGTQRIYTYPIDLQSDLAGVETNPATGKTYQVDDVVENFQPLAKGVVIDDYLTNPLDPLSFSGTAFLQQFHSIRVRINDNIFGLDELALVSDFLKKITPSYVAFAVAMTSDFFDLVNIDDGVFQGIKLGDTILIDNASFGIPAALMFDSRTFANDPQIAFGEGVFWVRRKGEDLQTVDASFLVTIPSGGVQSPKANEDFEPPIVRAGDLLYIVDGENAGGPFTISSVSNDLQFTVSDGAPPAGFETAGNQKYLIVRKVVSLLVSGQASTVATNNTVTLTPTPSLLTNGVMPGDWLVLSNGDRHVVRLVKEQTPGSGVFNQVEVVPAPPATASGLDFQIIRPSFFESPSLVDYVVVSTGIGTLTSPANPLLPAVLEIGDELQIQDDYLTRVTVLDSKNLYVTPSLPAGSYTVKVIKQGRPDSAVGWDHIEKYDPLDVVEISLKETSNDVNCTSSSDHVTFTTQNPQALQARPGDLLILSATGNSTVDVGYGPGTFPIRSVDSTGVYLTVLLTASGPSPWMILRRR